MFSDFAAFKTDLLNEIAKHLGIPPQIVADGNMAASAPFYEEYDQRKRADLERWREQWQKSVIEPHLWKMCEQGLPELFWEPVFLLSPRGRMLKRRAEPLPLTITWDDVPRRTSLPIPAI